MFVCVRSLLLYTNTHTHTHTPQILVTQLQLADGHMIRANTFGQTEKLEKLVLTGEEAAMMETVRGSWKAILSLSNIEDHTDFFRSGAGSMDVTRYIHSFAGETFLMLLSFHPNIIVHVENVVSLFSSPSTSSQKVRKCGGHLHCLTEYL